VGEATLTVFLPSKTERPSGPRRAWISISSGEVFRQVIAGPSIDAEIHPPKMKITSGCNRW
jgi:hypothetical protein